MSNGRLSAKLLEATTNTVVYEVPIDKTTTSCTINLCNTGNTQSIVNVAISLQSVPIAGEYIEYGVSIPAKGVIERSGIVLSAGQKLVAHATDNNINASVWGYEE